VGGANQDENVNDLYWHMKEQGAVNIQTGFRIWPKRSAQTPSRRSIDVDATLTLTDFGIEKIEEADPTDGTDAGAEEEGTDGDASCTFKSHSRDCELDGQGTIFGINSLYVIIAAVLLVIILVLVLICCCCFKRNEDKPGIGFGQGEKGPQTRVGKRSDAAIQMADKNADSGDDNFEDEKVQA